MFSPDRSIQVGPATIHYVERGSGRPLVLLHGAPTTSYVYRHVVEHLAPHFRCIAPDFPGWGASPPEPGRPPTLRALGRTTAAFLDALDLRGAIIAVMDTAGSPGVWAARARPGRVAGLVAADTLVFPTRAYPRIHRMLGVVTLRPVRALHRRTGFLPALVARFGGRGRTTTTADRRRYGTDFRDPARRDRVMDLLRDLRQDQDFLGEVAGALPSLAIPVLVVAGAADPVHRAGAMDALARAVPHPTVVEIPGESHFPHEGDPDTLAGAVLGWARAVGLAADEVAPTGAGPGSVGG